MIGKKEMVAKIAENESVTKVAAEEMYEAVFGALVDTLEVGEEVAVPGLGRFKIVERAEREAHNPRTGDAVVVPAHKALKFVPAKGLKETVAEL